MGSKELREYMEVVGYGEAAKWVYGQALEPGDWTNGDLLSLQEVPRSITWRWIRSGGWRRTPTHRQRRLQATGESMRFNRSLKA